MPLVSVIMPVFNGMKFLGEAIQSIINQTFTDFEFIIIDDGSTDGSADIVRQFEDARIILLSNTINMGITKSLNKALDHANGKFICRMDADDVALPERLAKQVEFIQEHSDIAIVGTCALLIDFAGREIGKEGISCKRVGLSKFIHNPFLHSTVLVRREIFSTVGSYNEVALHSEDYDLWLRVLRTYKGCVLADCLLKRRIHQESITQSREIEVVENRLKTLARAVFEYYKNPLLTIFLVRPLIALWYRKLKKRLYESTHFSDRSHI